MKNFVKRFDIKKLIVILSITSVIFLLLNGGKIIASDWFGRPPWYGYFNNRLDQSGYDVINGGLGWNNPGYNINNLESDIVNHLKGNNIQNKIGARFIVMTMLGKPAGTAWNAAFENEWKNAIAPYKDANPSNGWVDMNGSVVVYNNTYYQGDDKQDVAHYYPDSPLLGQAVIVFHHSDGTVYTIRKQCGNPVNDPSRVPPPEPKKSIIDRRARVENVENVNTDGVLIPTISWSTGGKAKFTNEIVQTQDNLGSYSAGFYYQTDVTQTATGGSTSWSAPKTVARSWMYNGTMTPGVPVGTSSTFTVNPGDRDAVGEYCRDIITSGSNDNRISFTGNGRACVRVNGSDFNLSAQPLRYERKSGEPKVIKNSLAANYVYCNSGFGTGIPIPITIKGIFNGREQIVNTAPNTKTVSNCIKNSNLLNLDDFIITEDLDNVGTYPVGDLWQKYKLEAVVGTLTFESLEATITVAEAPYVIFQGNDVKSCTDAINNRFVFKKNDAFRGSKSIMASIWSASSTPIPDLQTGYSSGVNSSVPTNTNKLKTTGLTSCGTSPNTTSFTAGPSTIGGSFSGKQEPTRAKTVYIDSNITSTYDYFDNTNFNNPPVWLIEADNIYISSNVDKLVGVELKAKENVYTCAYLDGPNPAAVAKNLWDEVPSLIEPQGCRKPLTIDGSISAKNLVLMRSIGSRYASEGGSAQNVSPTTLNQPAELIRYPAYFYFTNVGASGAGSTKGSIDSYSQAAPRL